MKTVGMAVSFWNDYAMVAFCIVINANAAFTFHFTALSTFDQISDSGSEYSLGSDCEPDYRSSSEDDSSD